MQLIDLKNELSGNSYPGILSILSGKLSYKLSILKSMQNNESSLQRFFYEYPEPMAGSGHFIHTYDSDGDPIPTFSGTPKEVKILDNAEDFADLIWNNLNFDNKVSLFVRYIDLATGSYKTIINNKNV